MAEHGLTIADLALSRPTRQARAKQVPAKRPKFRNPETGDVWSGRGPRPRWVRALVAQGRSLADFAA
jgi:DNA-binding protein H-NS